MTVTVQPGDVLATRSPGLFPRLIRLAAALKDEPDTQNHIAIAHHVDKAGTLWCLEGRPGGVGWRDARAYLTSPWTVSNAAQPKTDSQRAIVCQGAVALIGTGYDWSGIAADAAGSLGLEALWHPTWNGTVPGHVVCSSLAAWLYTKAGLSCPAGGRETTPADWLAFLALNHWETAA